jgi:hypothetical protein
MRVKVPRDLAGGSLLKAHQWVKSSLVRSNPHSSTNDYKLQQVDGTPISLSDLTSRSYDEVLVITGAKSNPIYPAPGREESWGYPSYTKNRLGNKATVLLGKDVDPSMVERLAAQNGMFSALNTVTKLLYTTENIESGTDPKIAALLQTYTNAMAAKKNPGRPFFATSINDRFRGVVSPEEAVRSFISTEYGVDPTLGKFDADKNSTTSYLIDRAKIVRKYDLDNPTTIKDFYDDVLSPFLVMSIANAKMLKSIQHQDYVEMLKTSLLIGKDSDLKDNSKYQKLISMVPTRAIEFYDGIDYALVAHPLFMRDSLGLAVTNKKLVNHITKIAKAYPQNTVNAIHSRDEKITRDLKETIVDRFSPEKNLLWNMVQSQQDVLNHGTTPEETLKALRDIFDSKTRDADIAKYATKLDPKFLVSYQRDVAGFRPTAPPYWPKPVVLSLMDALRNNIHSFTEGELDVSAAFIPFILNQADLSEPPEKYEPVIDVLDHMVDLVEEAKDTGGAVKSAEMIRILKTVEDMDKSLWYEPYLKNLNIEKKIESFNKKKNTTEKKRRNMIYNTFIRVGNEMTETVERSLIVDSSALETPSKIIHLLSVFMEIEDTARNKYNYTMSENDRAFALYLLESVAGKISKHREKAKEYEEDNTNLINVLEGLNMEGGMDENQLNNRISFEVHMKKIMDAARLEITAANDNDKDQIKESIIQDLETQRRIPWFQRAPNWVHERLTNMLYDIQEMG